MEINVTTTVKPTQQQVITLYKQNKWSAANKPKQLYKALMHSHSLVTAWYNDELLGLGNAISDGFLVVYYPHLLVLPKYQHCGVGKAIMQKMHTIYKDFHMKMLTADKEAIPFYTKMGFEKAGETQSMWIYNGNEH